MVLEYDSVLSGFGAGTLEFSLLAGVRRPPALSSGTIWSPGLL